MIKYLLNILFLLIALRSDSQSMADLLVKIKLDPDQFIQTDLRPSDTTNTKEFYALSFHDGSNGVALFEARYFRNADSTFTIAITYMHGDEQCDFYHSLFYEYSAKKDTFFSLPDGSVLPDLYFNTYDPKVARLVKNRLAKERKKKDMGKTDEYDILTEIYSTHFMLGGSTVIAINEVCDEYQYEFEFFTEADRAKIETNKWVVNLDYDWINKRFVIGKAGYLPRSTFQ